MAEWSKAAGLRSASVYTAWVQTPLVATIAFIALSYKSMKGLCPTSDFNSVEECLTVVV